MYTLFLLKQPFLIIHPFRLREDLHAFVSPLHKMAGFGVREFWGVPTPIVSPTTSVEWATRAVDYSWIATGSLRSRVLQLSLQEMAEEAYAERRRKIRRRWQRFAHQTLADERFVHGVEMAIGICWQEPRILSGWGSFATGLLFFPGLSRGNLCRSIAEFLIQAVQMRSNWSLTEGNLRRHARFWYYSIVAPFTREARPSPPSSSSCVYKVDPLNDL